MESKEYSIPTAYVFCLDNLHVKDNYIYLPIYMIAFVTQIPVEETIYKFDLTGLKALSSN